MTKSEDVRNILKSMLDDEVAQAWSRNDLIIKKIAISHEEMMKDSGDYLELQGFVDFCLENQQMADERGEEYL